MWRQKGHAIGFGVVAKRVVAGDDLALCLREGTPSGAHLGIQAFELFCVGSCIFLIAVAARCVCAAQAFGNVFHIRISVGHALPGVWVGFAVVVFVAFVCAGLGVVVVIFGFQHVGTLSGHHVGAFVVGRFQQACHPALKAQPVGKQHLRFGDGFGLGGCGLVHVCVGVGAHQHIHLHAVAAHLANHVAQDAEAGHGLHGRGCVGGQGAQRHRAAQGGQGKQL